MIDVEHESATYYYHFDALGSVVALTNSSGSTVELYEYSVYGQVAASDANNPNRFMFTGREFDQGKITYGRNTISRDRRFLQNIQWP
jgi:uncharacterized protein RhaS with RHS repeats